MATIFFAWELGGGLGHMLPMLPLAQGLAKQGHCVYVAPRNLAGATAVFGRAGVRLLPAPFKPDGMSPPRRTLNFAHLLANVGWGDSRELFGLASGWRNLFRLTRPDLIVFDHSPTALLAARGAPTARRVLLGPGFQCPPDSSPFPPFVPTGGPDSEERDARLRRALLNDEQPVLAAANHVLRRWGLPALDRLGRLYGDVHETLLTTFPELDPYAPRPGTHYWGAGLSTGGKIPEWPAGQGKRVYGYLKDFPALPDLLSVLIERGNPAIIFGDGIPAAIVERFTSPTLRFERERLDLNRISRECDLALHNAGHGTMCHFLLAGRPSLAFPLTPEQAMGARGPRRLGVIETAPAKPGHASEIATALDRVLGEPRCAQAAARFANSYGGTDGQLRREEAMLARLCELLPPPRPSHYFRSASTLGNSGLPSPTLCPAGSGSASRFANVFRSTSTPSCASPSAAL
jgi:hypothetical protein